MCLGRKVQTETDTRSVKRNDIASVVDLEDRAKDEDLIEDPSGYKLGRKENKNDTSDGK